MVEESTDLKKGTASEQPFGTETMGATTRSLFAMAPVVLEPGLIVLEKFKIIDLLGQGGMGSVYRVEHLLMGRQFALKCLNKFQEADASWRRFQNEAKAAHLLDHANLLKVYEFGLLPGGQPFFLMELVEGANLADEIKKLGQLPVERAVRIFIQVAFALSYAHESHVIHRDIKPSNIMVSSKGQEGESETVKVVDFGIAKLTGIDEFNQQTLTKTGEIFGSPLYMSPEQCTGVSVDQRSDLYSLGCVFYETLTGAPPFIGETALSTMMKHQGEKPLSLKEASLGTQYPQALEEIVSKLLEKDPNDRYQTANALAKDLIKLERRLTEESKSTLAAVSSTQVLKKPSLQEGHKEITLSAPTASLLLAAAAVVFALGALTSYLLLYPSQKTEQKETSATSNKRADQAGSGRASGSNQPPGDAAVQVAAQLDGEDPQYEASVKSAKRWSITNRMSRNYRFPQKQSLGAILTDGGVVKEAIGEFSVKPEDLIGLVPNDYLLMHPTLMDKFAPDELTLVDLNASQLNSPDFYARLGNFPKLKFLNAFYTNIKSSLPVLKKLPELVYLSLGWSRVNCRELLNNLHPEHLNYLDVTYSEEAKLIPLNIQKFPKLDQLLLFKCNLKNDDIKPLAKSRLRTLCLGWNDDIDNTGVAQLIGLKTLVKIDLSNTKVTAGIWQVLAKFPRLQTVKLARIPWTRKEKLYFAKQMRLHAPDVRIDTDATNFKEFTQGTTDVDWLNRGTDAHDWPFKEIVEQSASLIENELKRR